MEHLETNNKLSGKQFGLQKGQLLTINLTGFYSIIIDTIQKRDGWADCVYLDLKKAFDEVTHKRLLWKLSEEGGTGGRLQAWMKDDRGRHMTKIKPGKAHLMAYM